MAGGRYQQGISVPTTLGAHPTVSAQNPPSADSLRRYQGGIGVPTHLGVQPTIYRQPEFSFRHQSIPHTTIGFSRNYGSTPEYVDTRSHRWNYGSGSIADSIQNLIGRAIVRTAQAQSAQAQNAQSQTLSPPTGTGQAYPYAPPTGPGQAYPYSPPTGAPQTPGPDIIPLAQKASDKPFTPSKISWAEEGDTNPFPQGPLAPTGESHALDVNYRYTQQGRRYGNKRYPA